MGCLKVSQHHNNHSHDLLKKLSQLVVGNVTRPLIQLLQVKIHPSTQPTTSKYGNVSPYIDVIRTLPLLRVIITTAARWRLSLKRNYRFFLATDITTYCVVFLGRTGLFWIVNSYLTTSYLLHKIRHNVS